jgi:hypothetical protein
VIPSYNAQPIKMMKISVVAALMLLAADVLGGQLPPRKLEDHPRELEQDRELAETAAPSAAPPGKRVKRE